MKDDKAGLKDVVAAPSAICYIDGDKGELVYAGINIHELAENANFEEVSYLLLHRKLPNVSQFEEFDRELKGYRQIPEAIVDILRRLPKNAEPMDTLRTAVSALGIYEAKPQDNSAATQYQRVLQLISQMAIIIAYLERIRKGQELVAPRRDLSHAANFLYMLNGVEPDATAIRALDIALILHADHGFNASTFAARVTASTLADVYSAITSAIGTLKGPLHGGANQRVMEMLLDIGDQDPIAYVKAKIANKEKIMGFGHRVYHTEDPRATHLRKMSEELSRSTGHPHWYETSRKIELFINAEKKLNANVDFYSASVYYSLGIPADLFTPIFALSRMSGWGAHVLEQLANNKLIRPREDYIGPKDQHFVPLAERA